jgi:signal transduction histidine kinase
VAKQWRIRHKLLLGLVLVVGVLALLLGGTFRGLWSYYVTTDTVRNHLAELKAAEEFKEAVTRLVADDQMARLLQHPDHRVTAAKEAACKKLDAYEELVLRNLNQSHDADNGEQAKGYIERLRKSLDQFERDMVVQAEFAEARLPGGAVVRDRPAGGKAHEPSPPHEAERPQADDPAAPEAPLREQAQTLLRDARDMRDIIYKQLDDRLHETRRHYQVSLWIVVPASVVGVLLMAGLMRSFYAWIFHPIRDLEAGVKLVAGGDFAHRIEVHSGDEMEDLGAAFNDMTRRLHTLYSDLARQVNERSRQLVRSERLASVGFLAAGVAHEINNPLASIAFCSEALEARLGDLLRLLPGPGRRGDDLEVFTRYLKMIQEEAFRCKHITERLLAFSRSGERKREPTDLAALVQSVLDVTQHLPGARGKSIRFEKPERRVVAPANAEEIKSVVLNLVINALNSMDEGGKLTIDLRQHEGMAELQFSDSGCGMTPDILENIFEPFFTRSRTGEGTGLGLTISHLIITQHGGEIEAFSDGPGQGSTFLVRLPLRVAEAAPGPEAGRGKAPSSLAA